MGMIDDAALRGEFPVSFLAAYGPQFYAVVDVLAGMAARGELASIKHSAELMRLILNAAVAVAAEVQKKSSADWAPKWVI